MSYEKRSYGLPRRVIPKPYSLKLEAIENYKNKIITNEYLPTITKHMKTLQTNSQVNPAMIDLQPEVKWFMRPYLVNFIIQMHASLKLKPQTLFLCWNIIDRYAAKRIAFKQHYQLIGCVALWIAAKYEDKKSRVPTVSELSLMCSNVYDESMFKEMEIHILSTLGWSLGHTTVEDILQLSVKFSDPDGKEKLDKPIDSYKSNSPQVSSILAIGRYLGELSLYERNYLNYDSTLIGITAHLIACSMLGWDCGARSIDSIYQQYMISQYRQSLSSHCGLSTPVTPTKMGNDFFYENDESQFEENDSHTTSQQQHQQLNEFGPFVTGFNGLDTIKQLRTLSIMLLKSMLNPPEVLIEKIWKMLKICLKWALIFQMFYLTLNHHILL
ncbi:unnamed protein product [Ambrosiozyma monospora]|uniref:Unnamed protein product n=1 Tax=Ambrosiozyma monospora TaxID=43982 RepID=A0A9W6YY07_AMBMO|nr:unnamed protein product [Ambrosiozyma monospora]